MIRKIILSAVSLYLFCNSTGCTEKEEKSVPQSGKVTPKQAAAIDSLLEESASEMRRREQVVYFQNHIEPVLASYLKDGITSGEYTQGIAKLEDYRKRYADLERFDGNKPNSDYYLKEGLSNQAEIKLILVYSEGLSRSERENLIKRALESILYSEAGFSTIRSARLADKDIYQKLYAESKRLGYEDIMLKSLKDYIEGMKD